MLTRMKRVWGAIAFAFALAITSSAQSNDTGQRAPSNPARQFVVLSAQSLGDLERKLRADNQAEDLIGGEGMQLRVAVQHEMNKAPAAAEVHDASDDVYYVLEGGATLTLGGKLEAPREVELGEWRGPRIIGGQTIEIAKGDLIVVPRGTPHARNTTGKRFSMILIKIYAEPLRPAQPQPAPKTKSQRP